MLRGSVAYSQPFSSCPFCPSSFEQEPEALGSVGYIVSAGCLLSSEERELKQIPDGLRRKGGRKGEEREEREREKLQIGNKNNKLLASSSYF